MKNIFIGFIILGLSIKAIAEDVFPVFSTAPITIAIPTNTPGCIMDQVYVVGTNFVYTMNGQIFSNAVDGHLQTIAEGFSGTTDRSTPWKTLTELMAVNQQGCPENKMRSLYTATSQDFLDKMYGDPDMIARYKSMASSITNMHIYMGYDFTNGYLAWVILDHPNRSVAQPCFMVQSNGKYLLSTYKSSETNFNNVLVFLHSKLGRK